MKDFSGIERILVMKLRHIGDVLLAVPAVRALRESFPGARISALVNSGTEEMLSLNPLLHEVMTFDRSIKGRSPGGRLSGEVRLIREIKKRRFDMAVDLTGGDRAALTGFLAGARVRLGYDPGKKGLWGKKRLYTHAAERPPHMAHTVLRDLGLLRRFGITTRDLTVDIHASPKDEAYVKGLLEENDLLGKPYVHVHPVSRWLFKCWTDEGSAYVMDRLAEAGFPVVVTSGPHPAEVKKVETILARMKTRPLNLSGRLKLKHLASLSRGARLFFGVDSAPMHIAAASGTRVVSVFGPSGAFHWGPWDNEEARKLSPGKDLTPYPAKNGIQRFGKNTVVQMNWECIPCGKDGCNGSKKSDCLDSLTPESVWNIISMNLEGS